MAETPQPDPNLDQTQQQAVEASKAIVDGGIPGYEIPENPITIDRPADRPLVYGDRVGIAEEDFKGDVTRVLGHPQNAHAGIATVIVDQMKRERVAREAADEAQRNRPLAPGAITEVPGVDSVSDTDK